MPSGSGRLAYFAADAASRLRPSESERSTVALRNPGRSSFGRRTAGGRPLHWKKQFAVGFGAGDSFIRTCLYGRQRALTKVQRCSPLKAWGVRLASDWGAKGPGCDRAQACRHPALHLDGRHPILVDEGDGHGLTPSFRLPNSASAELLSLPGRRVEITAKSPSAVRIERARSGRFKHSGVNTLTPMMGRFRIDPGENHDPGRRWQSGRA